MSKKTDKAEGLKKSHIKTNLGVPFVKGDPRCGRPKGCKNKFTDLKAGFLNAYEMIGGEKALGKWGKRNQPEFYKLVARMLPTNVNFQNPLSVNVSGGLSVTSLKQSAEAYVKENDRADGTGE
jgi:hypothetical protein